MLVSVLKAKDTRIKSKTWPWEIQSSNGSGHINISHYNIMQI